MSHQAGDYYYDSVGRRRKLSAGAIKDIQREFYHGVPATKLAEQYNVSPGLIRTVCYNTPRQADEIRQRERQKEEVNKSLTKGLDKALLHMI